jgi:YidC/Oxa1 family membrane protein insertase
MKEEQRVLIAGGLSLAVLAGWYFLIGKNMMTPPPAPESAPTVISETIPATQSGSASAPGAVKVPEAPEIIVQKETPLLLIDWSNRGGRPTKIQLKKYHEGVSQKSPLINLLSFEGEKGLFLSCDSCNRPLPDDGDYRLVAHSDKGIIFEAAKNGIVFRKEYQWNDDPYLLNLRVTVENGSPEAFRGRLGLGWRAKQLVEEKKKFGFLGKQSDQRSFVYEVGTEVSHDRKKDELARDIGGVIPWTGIDNRYFFTSIISRRVSSDQLLHLERKGEWLTFILYSGETVVPSKGKQEENYSFYVGPKERDTLQGAHVDLEKVIDYGWFSILAIPILKLLKIFHAVVGNWGVAIILLTVFVKILMNPLTIKSMKQMKEMQRLQPQLAELKEKFKNDRQRLNVETMQLFKKHGVNPMGGCLPMVLQMPIYIALYKVLYNGIELYHAPFFWFYRDLAAPDPYFILPILLGIAMLLQQKLTPSTSTDPMQKQMMMIMPIMFTSFMLFLPMGLVLYIFVNTGSGVLQQWMSQKGLRWRDLAKFKWNPA